MTETWVYIAYLYWNKIRFENQTARITTYLLMLNEQFGWDHGHVIIGNLPLKFCTELELINDY